MVSSYSLERCIGLSCVTSVEHLYTYLIEFLNILNPQLHMFRGAPCLEVAYFSMPLVYAVHLNAIDLE